ncbi:hypothetical protein GCM10023263_51910 [Phytohabitans rumicis]
MNRRPSAGEVAGLQAGAEVSPGGRRELDYRAFRRRRAADRDAAGADGHFDACVRFALSAFTPARRSIRHRKPAPPLGRVPAGHDGTTPHLRCYQMFHGRATHRKKSRVNELWLHCKKGIRLDALDLVLRKASPGV